MVFIPFAKMHHHSLKSSQIFPLQTREFKEKKFDMQKTLYRLGKNDGKNLVFSLAIFSTASRTLYYNYRYGKLKQESRMNIPKCSLSQVSLCNKPSSLPPCIKFCGYQIHIDTYLTNLQKKLDNLIIQ